MRAFEQYNCHSPCLTAAGTLLVFLSAFASQIALMLNKWSFLLMINKHRAVAYTVELYHEMAWEPKVSHF